MQNTNPTADGKNEMLYAGIVADMLMQKLKSTPGIEVMLAYDGISLATVQQQIKTFKPDCAIDIHTDAGGGRGTTALTNPQTQKFGEIVLKYVSAVNPSDPARGVKDGRQFAFINYGGIIVEMLFHDNLADTQYYVSHFADYANALYLAILEYLKVSVPTNGGDIVLDGIIIMFGDGDLAGGLNAHFLT
jgi:N-acetylmuramoyl-L-alanine amidase